LDKEKLGHALSAGGTGLVTLATAGSVGSLAVSTPGTAGGVMMWVCLGLVVVGGIAGVIGKGFIAYAIGKE
jgi:hypothetical protein